MASPIALMPAAVRADQYAAQLIALADLLVRKHGWDLPILAEMVRGDLGFQLIAQFPNNPNLLGLNYNKGAKICIRLRPHHAPDSPSTTRLDWG